jgi:hypothetical protein
VEEGAFDLILTAADCTVLEGSEGEGQRTTAIRQSGEQGFTVHRQIGLVDDHRDNASSLIQLEDDRQELVKQSQRLVGRTGEEPEKSFLTVVECGGSGPGASEVGNLQRTAGEQGLHQQLEILALVTGEN